MEYFIITAHWIEINGSELPTPLGVVVMGARTLSQVDVNTDHNGAYTLSI